MVFRPRRPCPQNEDGDRRLSAAEEDDGFDCYKPTEEEKEALCHAILFEDEKDPNILLDAKPAESMVQPAGDLQHEVKIEEESDVEGSYELPLNAADLLAEPDAQETFDCYNFPEEERTPSDEDSLFVDVKRPDTLCETNSTGDFSQGFRNVQNKVKNEDKSEDDGFRREALLTAAELTDHEDIKEKLNEKQVKMKYESEDDGSQGKASLNAAVLAFDEDEQSGHPVGRLLFTCLLKNCPCSFKTFEEIEEHMEIHSDEEDFFCDACKKTFFSKDDVLAHLHGREMKKCCACETKQSCCANLVRHLRAHTGERPLLCKTCGKGYARQAHLNAHLLTHTGVKAFVCGFCKKGFGLKHQLQSHIRIHTGEKPYKCKNCDFKCSSQSVMVRHNRTHTGERPYSCGFCGKRFTQSAALRWHELTHSGVKPHECEHCGKRFKDRSSMNKHIRVHTGEKKKRKEKKKRNSRIIAVSLNTRRGCIRRRRSLSSFQFISFVLPLFIKNIVFGSI